MEIIIITNLKIVKCLNMIIQKRGKNNKRWFWKVKYTPNATYINIWGGANMIPIDTDEKLKEQIKKIENETGLSKGYTNLEER